jgi:hypothetical protein
MGARALAMADEFATDTDQDAVEVFGLGDVSGLCENCATDLSCAPINEDFLIVCQCGTSYSEDELGL